MLWVNTLSYYDEDNVFRLKAVLVSDGEVTYALSPETAFSEQPYPVDLVSLVESNSNNVSFPVLGFNKMRTWDDDDAHSLATYLGNKFRNIGKITPREEKVIFDVVSGFGHE